MYLLTTHKTVLGCDDLGNPCQVTIEERDKFIRFDPENSSAFSAAALKDFQINRVERGITLFKDGCYLCAVQNSKSVVVDRNQAGSWETFVPVGDRELSVFESMFINKETEMKRFSERVMALSTAGDPVKIYCGCGDIVRPGFIHLDIVMMAPALAVESPEDYFIFPFVDVAWDLPDGCVDYIFHEDMIEHLTQLQQIQFLAEAKRCFDPDLGTG